MDGSSTVARFIQRFREAAPLSPDERRRERDAMEGQFWWALSSKDSNFESDRSSESGCGTPPPPPIQDASVRDFETSQSRGTRACSNRDLEASRSRRRAPPPPYGGHTPLNFSEHKTAVEASGIDAAQQDTRSEFEGGCYPNGHRQDAPVESEGGCQPNMGRGQTMLASSLLSPGSAGPPGPPSDDGGYLLEGIDGLHLVHELHQVHQHTLADEAEVGELAASLPEHHQTAASTFGASSSRLPAEKFVGPIEGHHEGLDGEGCDELANLDARASSLLEHCRQLLSAPPTDDADQEATHYLPGPFSSGGVGGSKSAVERAGVVDNASSHSSYTRQGLEQRAWMLLDNREPLEPWEANVHGSLRVLSAGGDVDLSPAVRSHQYDKTFSRVSYHRCDHAARQSDVPAEGLAQQAVPTEGLAQQGVLAESLARARNEVSTTYDSATDGSTFSTDRHTFNTGGNTFNTDGITLKTNVTGLLNGGENHSWSCQQENKNAKGDGGGDSRSLFLRSKSDDYGDSRSRLLRNEFPANPATSWTVGGTDEAHTCGRSAGQIQKCDRELTLPGLNPTTGHLLTDMGSLPRKITEGEMPLGVDHDGLVGVPDATAFRQCCKTVQTVHASPAEPSWAISSRFGLSRNPSQQGVSATTPSAREGRQEDSSVASLNVFAQDPVMVALVERAHQIEEELERRRLFGIYDGKQPPPISYGKVGPDGIH